jgi:hypothetical protein
MSTGARGTMQSIRTNAVAAFLAPALAAWSRCAEGGLLCSKLRAHPHTGPVFGAADRPPQGNTTQQALQQPPKRLDTAPRTKHHALALAPAPAHQTPHTTHHSAARLPKSAPRWPRRVARAADCSAVRSTYLLRALALSRPPRATPTPSTPSTSSTTSAAATPPPPPQPPAVFPCVIRLCSQSILLSAIPHSLHSPLIHTLPDQSLIPLFVIQVPQLPSSAQPSTTQPRNVFPKRRNASSQFAPPGSHCRLNSRRRPRANLNPAVRDQVSATKAGQQPLHPHKQ